MERKKYILYNIGNKDLKSHIDAVHAQSPNSDQFTGEIVKGVINKINASGIIGIVSRDIMDLNRPRSKKNAPAIDEYRSAINAIVGSKKILDVNSNLTRNYLHLAIHGMKNHHKNEFEIGTRSGNSCSEEIIKWFMESIQVISKKVSLNNIFKGDGSKVFHRRGDLTSNYSGYGEKFNTIQIEINREWRENKQEELINYFSNVIQDFDIKFKD